MDGHWIDLYKSCVFYACWKFKMAAFSGHSFNIGSYGTNCENFLLWQHLTNLKQTSHGWSLNGHL